MIQYLDGFPENIVGFAARGHVTKADYEGVLIPKIEAAFKKYPRIRLYYELGTEFSGLEAGAAWEDFKVGVEHLTRWERVAIVTDVDWIRHMVNVFRFLMPGEIRVFHTLQAGEAKAWLASQTI